MDKIVIKNLSVKVQNKYILKSLNFNIKEKEILAIIGPANSGKTTFLRVLNRLTELTPEIKIEGEVLFDGKNIFNYEPSFLRRKLGMLFALPIPLQGSIFDNLTLPLKLNGSIRKKNLNKLIEKSLMQAALWEELKDRLKEPATNLSGGQQQRLCLARILMLEPEVLLLDEPCAGLDPISTAKIEESLQLLKNDITIIFVTNNVKQAARISQKTAFFLSGELIEYDLTSNIFTNPKNKKTLDYITGRFG